MIKSGLLFWNAQDTIQQKEFSKRKKEVKGKKGEDKKKLHKDPNGGF